MGNPLIQSDPDVMLGKPVVATPILIKSVSHPAS